MEKIKEGKWKETARKYDFRGRCILERDALGNESLKEYEANRAYPSRVITPKGEETAYGYDTVGRRLSISNTYGTVELATIPGTLSPAASTGKATPPVDSMTAWAI